MPKKIFPGAQRHWFPLMPKTIRKNIESFSGMLTGILRRMWYLAAKGTEAEWIEEATLADLAGVGDSFSRPRLRAFIQEDDSCAVDNVGLDTGDVQHFLNLRNPDHIMVWWSPYLSMQMKKQSNPINDRWDLSVITWNSGQTMC